MVTVRERLSNVVNVFKAIATLQPVGANTGLGEKVDTAVGLVSQAAGTAAIGLGAAFVAASAPVTAAARAIGTKIATSFAKAPITTQAGVVAAGIVGGAALSSSEKLRSDVLKTPSSLANFGTNIGALYENPSLKTAGEIVKENPVISGLVGAGTIAIVGGGIASTVATLSNTHAVNENTKVATAAGAAFSGGTVPSNAIPVNDIGDGVSYSMGGSAPTASDLSPMNSPTTAKSVSSSRKRTKSKKKSQNLNINIRNYGIYAKCPGHC